MSARHLRYDLFIGRGFPREEMRALGISWQYLVGRSMGEDVLFLNCTNVPDVLPGYITEIKNFNPYEHIGHGLSFEMAEAVAKETARLNAKDHNDKSYMHREGDSHPRLGDTEEP